MDTSKKFNKTNIKVGAINPYVTEEVSWFKFCFHCKVE